MKFNEIARNIRKRKHPKDVFITPLELAKKCIKCHKDKNYIWYDPFKNTGNFYNNYPTENKKYSEILEGKDFFNFNERVDVISSNPPYSILNKVFEHSCKICEVEFGYLIGIHNLTTKRIEDCNKKGFYLKYIKMVKVYKWFGMSIYVIFSKEIKKNIIDFDRKIYH